MSNLVNLDNNTFGVAMPKDAKDFIISHWSNNSTTLEFFSQSYEMEYDSYSIDCETGLETKHKEITLSLEKINFEILGTASLTEITFDCEPYVESNYKLLSHSVYKDYYLSVGCIIWTKTAKQSFLSLLKSKGLIPTEETKILILKQK